MFRKEFKDWEPYKLPGQAKYNLGDNENRLMDWSFLLEETAKRLEASDLSFYGDNRYLELIEAYAAYLGVQANQVTAGVGSDFLINMIVVSTLSQNQVCLTVNPDFFMYQVYNLMHGSQFEQFDLPFENGRFHLVAENLLAYAKEVEATIIMFSNPNNPASTVFDSEQIEKLIRDFDGLVVVDEAYIEYADCPSFIHKIDRYKNLIVLRTLSKAFGLAGLRLGFAIACEEVIYELEKVIPPYSLSNLVAKMGTIALEYTDQVAEGIEKMKAGRADFIEFLESLEDCQVLPSQAGFVTFTAPWAESLYQEAIASEWNFKYYQEGPLANYIRMAIGRQHEMEMMKELIRTVIAKRNDQILQ